MLHKVLQGRHTTWDHTTTLANASYAYIIGTQMPATGYFLPKSLFVNGSEVPVERIHVRRCLPATGQSSRGLMLVHIWPVVDPESRIIV